MTSSPFTPSSSPPNQRTRLHSDRRSSTEEASRMMCIWISCVFAD
ncbi:unnamed protein product [Brassica oleracea]